MINDLAYADLHYMINRIKDAATLTQRLNKIKSASLMLDALRIHTEIALKDEVINLLIDESKNGS